MNTIYSDGTNDKTLWTKLKIKRKASRNWHFKTI